jgi:hypothetical protein
LGAIGPPGPQGAKGATGSQGAQGATGAQGAQGPPSDRRLKTNIQPLEDSTKKLLGLKGVRFQWKSDIPHLKEYGKSHDYLIKNKSLGFIAQEVENIFPEIIGQDKYGYKDLYIDVLTAVGLASIKENQHRIIIINNKLSPLKNLMNG